MDTYQHQWNLLIYLLVLQNFLLYAGETTFSFLHIIIVNILVGAGSISYILSS